MYLCSGQHALRNFVLPTVAERSDASMAPEVTKSRYMSFKTYPKRYLESSYTAMSSGEQMQEVLLHGHDGLEFKVLGYITLDLAGLKS